MLIQYNGHSHIFIRNNDFNVYEIEARYEEFWSNFNIRSKKFFFGITEVFE